jgi:hypothetical protein
MGCNLNESFDSRPLLYSKTVKILVFGLLDGVMQFRQFAYK